MKKKFYPDFQVVRTINTIIVCSLKMKRKHAYVWVNGISGNFNQDEISDPILDITLEAGDMLYFPRGTIHQVIIAVHFYPSPFNCGL